MAAITIKLDINKFAASMQTMLNKLKDRELLLRPVALEIIPQMTRRIHINGKASDDSNIGTYSNSYLKYRENNKRGKDPKVIVSLTRQLENDWAVLATERGYGIGFNNVLNANKAGWVEKTKNKKIFELSEKEKQYAIERLNELTSEIIRNNTGA